MSVMIRYGLHKEITVAAQEIQESGQQSIADHLDGDFAEFYKEENLQSALTVVLPAGYDADAVQISEDLTGRRVQLVFENVEPDYFHMYPLIGSSVGVYDIIARAEDGKTALDIYLDRFLACREERQPGAISLSFVNIREKYDKIVVLDAGAGGEESGAVYAGVKEKDINLDIVQRLKEKLEENDIAVLCTRIADQTISVQRRIELANESDADLFLGVQCSYDETDPFCNGITTYYNETFFIPEFGNADLAYEVEERLIHMTGAAALGLQAGEDEMELLRYIMTPAACVKVGFLSNEKERGLLDEASYRDKIAEGLYQAVTSSLEQIGKQR
ncbi:MAG: N-acetylmuramoyl-L-alanine amidase [Lachnospiraceae bacterium]|nr:N-acetylmuramoyl-L-alanine amidase [Lachnospiraceae bacterium]